MNVDPKLGLFHHHQLGYFNYVDEPQIYPRSGEIYSVSDVTWHEMAHKWLADPTTVGLYMRLLVTAYEQLLAASEPQDVEIQESKELINACTDLCACVHEGYATFVEFGKNSKGATREQFMASLEKERGEVYLEGFGTASLIDSIVAPLRSRAYSDFQIRMIAAATLLDISRFALSVPIPSDCDSHQFLSILKSDPPNSRWMSILNSLANDSHLGGSFLEESNGIFQTWVNKSARRFSKDGKYKGILYADNLDAILVRLFPQVPYSSVRNMSRINQVSIRELAPDDSIASYLLRESCAELHFSPLYALVHAPSIGAVELCRIFSLLKSTDAGCYVRFTQAPDNCELRVKTGGEEDNVLEVPRGSVAVFVHEALLNYDHESKRTWEYRGSGYSVIIPKDSIGEVLTRLSWPDGLAVFECNLDLFEDPFWPQVFSDVKSPIFLVPSRVGSLDSIVRTFSFADISTRLRFFVAPNWSHFAGAGNNQIYLVWLITEDGKVSVLNFATEVGLVGLQVWKDHVGFPERIEICGPSRFRSWNVSTHSDRWLPISKDGVLEAPQNADVVTAHAMSFGW